MCLTRSRSTYRGQGHVDFTSDTCGIERQSNSAIELRDKALLDEACPETLARRRPNGRTPVLFPSQAKLILQRVGLNGDLNSPIRSR
jgi:hypothetical protein